MMNRPVLAAIVMLAVPAVSFLGGAWVMDKLSGRKEVPKPRLNMRLHYDTEDATTYWGRFGKEIGTEKDFLAADLVFPFLYGGTLAGSLLMAWVLLGRPYPPVWILAPVLITVLADWTENLVQIGQLERHLNNTGVQAAWIQVASTATALKLSFLAASWLLLFFLVGRLLWRGA